MSKDNSVLIEVLETLQEYPYYAQHYRSKVLPAINRLKQYIVGQTLNLEQLVELIKSNGQDPDRLSVTDVLAAIDQLKYATTITIQPVTGIWPGTQQSTN